MHKSHDNKLDADPQNGFGLRLPHLLVRTTRRNSRRRKTPRDNQRLTRREGGGPVGTPPPGRSPLRGARLLPRPTVPTARTPKATRVPCCSGTRTRPLSGGARPPRARGPGPGPGPAPFRLIPLLTRRRPTATPVPSAHCKRKYLAAENGGSADKMAAPTQRLRPPSPSPFRTWRT